MAGYWTVQQGDYLSKIAFEFGFGDYKTFWDHPENAKLKAKRKNPNVLFPGDELYVPDLIEKEELRPTDQRHRFQLKGQKLKLRIVLKDVNDKPIANTDCELQVDGSPFRLTTDGNGQIEQGISKTAESGKLTVKDAKVPIDVEIPLKIGHLDPVDEVTGQVARLNNLGYDAGKVSDTGDTGNKDNEAKEQFRSAVEEFQCDHGLKVDGICGPATQAKLKDVHGC